MGAKIIRSQHIWYKDRVMPADHGHKTLAADDIDETKSKDVNISTPTRKRSSLIAKSHTISLTFQAYTHMYIQIYGSNRNDICNSPEYTEPKIDFLPISQHPDRGIRDWSDPPWGNDALMINRRGSYGKIRVGAAVYHNNRTPRIQKLYKRVKILI